MALQLSSWLIISVSIYLVLGGITAAANSTQEMTIQSQSLSFDQNSPEYTEAGKGGLDQTTYGNLFSSSRKITQLFLDTFNPFSAMPDSGKLSQLIYYIISIIRAIIGIITLVVLTAFIFKGNARV